jgi:hypothetical protein
VDHFSVGVVSILLAIAFPAGWFLWFQFRRVAAWSKREPGPKDRVGFFVVLLTVLGFAVGSFAQPVWDRGVECWAAGQPIGACLIAPH